MAIPHNLRKGVILRMDGKPYLVLDYWEARTAQRRATLHVKLKDVLQGKVLERTLDDKVQADVIDSHNRLLQYLYSDAGACHFMDSRTFDQLAVPKEVIGDSEPFLVEETEYRVLFLDEQPVLVEIPPTVVLEVVETPPSAGTASGNTTKAAKLKNGLEVKVPRFIVIGDKVRINTETREYLGKENE
ncbi:MAG: elongation factor P [Planctomycetes bacterium]|nr:elongation factor P [Planctomycetota bacterium]